MKKIVFLFLISFLFLSACQKKKSKKEVPDLNTENTQEVLTDTILTSQENDFENQTEDENISEKEENQPKENKKQYQEPTESRKPREIYGNYSVQIISLTNYDKILSIKRKLSDEGYETELSTINKDGKIFYRLRLKETYTKSYAKKMGEEVKNNFKFITGYWIQKIK